MITLHDEVIDEEKPYELFDPEYTWKKKTVTNFRAHRLLVPIFETENVLQKPGIEDIRNYCKKQTDTLWEEVKRFENPHQYYVDLSLPLWQTKEALLQKYSV